MAEIVERRSLENRDDLNKILRATRDYYGAYTEKYVQFYEGWLRSEGQFSDPEYKIGYDRVAKILEGLAEEGLSIIDVGSGVGTWSKLMAEKGAYITSSDNCPEAISKCRRASEETGLVSRINPILSDGLHMPFRNGAFDGATLNWVLAHVPVKMSQAFMREVERVLKVNAWLMLSDSYWRGQKGGKEQVQVRRTGEGIFEVYKYYYAPEELQKLFRETLGEVTRLQTTPYEMLCVARKTEK